MPHRPAPALIILLSLGLAGCNGRNVNFTYDRQTDFSRLKTYRWKEGEQFGVAGRRVGEQTIPQVVLAAADRDLSAKGMRRLEEGDADLIIEYSTKIEFEQVQVPSDVSGGHFSNPDAYSDAAPWPDQTQSSDVPETYARFTVGFKMLDPKLSEAVWQGSGNVRLRQRATPDQRRHRLNGLVDSVLGKYPPKGAR